MLKFWLICLAYLSFSLPLDLSINHSVSLSTTCLSVGGVGGGGAKNFAKPGQAHDHEARLIIARGVRPSWAHLAPGLGLLTPLYRTETESERVREVYNDRETSGSNICIVHFFMQIFILGKKGFSNRKLKGSTL
jgi:hypothetical protein